MILKNTLAPKSKFKSYKYYLPMLPGAIAFHSTVHDRFRGNFKIVSMAIYILDIFLSKYWKYH